MKLQDSIVIQADRSRVFEVFCDLEHAAEHVRGISKIEILRGPAQLELGTAWRETRVMFGREATEDMAVTSWERDRSYAAEAESHGAHYLSEYLFTDVDGGTRVDLSFVSTPLTFGAKVANVVFAAFAGASKKAFREDLEDLKAVCERGANPA